MKAARRPPPGGFFSFLDVLHFFDLAGIVPAAINVTFMPVRVMSGGSDVLQSAQGRTGNRSRTLRLVC